MVLPVFDTFGGLCGRGPKLLGARFRVNGGMHI